MEGRKRNGMMKTDPKQKKTKHKKEDVGGEANEEEEERRMRRRKRRRRRRGGGERGGGRKRRRRRKKKRRKRRRGKEKYSKTASMAKFSRKTLHLRSLFATSIVDFSILNFNSFSSMKAVLNQK